MLNDTDGPNTTAAGQQEVSAGHALEREILFDLLITVSGFGVVVALILLAVQTLSLA
jgi:hypothetical protein